MHDADPQKPVWDYCWPKEKYHGEENPEYNGSDGIIRVRYCGLAPTAPQHKQRRHRERDETNYPKMK